MKYRPIGALLAGGFVWMFLFPVLIWLTSLSWPSLQHALQAFRETHRFDVFSSTSMLLLFQLLWLLTHSIAGFVTALISRRRTEALILMGIVVAYLAYRHFWTEWDQFPAWYNLAVVILAAPMFFVGWMAAEFVGSHRVSDESVAGG